MYVEASQEEVPRATCTTLEDAIAQTTHITSEQYLTQFLVSGRYYESHDHLNSCAMYHFLIICTCI